MITISDGVPVPLVIEKKSMLLYLWYPSLANPLGSTKKRKKIYILLNLDDLSYTWEILKRTISGLLVFLCLFMQPLLNEDLNYLLWWHKESNFKVEMAFQAYQENKTKRYHSYLSVRKLQIKCLASFDISMSSGNCNEFLWSIIFPVQGKEYRAKQPSNNVENWKSSFHLDYFLASGSESD